MNKLFTKVAALTLGVAMAAGVGVAVGASQKASPVHADNEYELVKNVSSLSASDKVVIASGVSGAVYTMSTTQNSNNRSANGTFTVTNDKITVDSSTQVFTLGKDGDNFTFLTDTGYIYAASSSSNHLRTKTALDDNGKWSVSIAATGAATVVAQGTNTRNILKFNANNGNPIFSAYSSSGTVAIFKATTTPVGTQYDVTDSVENGSVLPSTVSEGATLNATITPDSGYLVPETVSVTMGGTAATHTYQNGVVTVENVTGDVEITGSCVAMPSPEHAGTLEDPYTVEDAYRAIDKGTGLANVYVRGITAGIVTSWSSDHNNISFNISDDGSTDKVLQAYRCISSEAHAIASDSDVPNGATVVMYGTLKKYKTTYELDQGCYIAAYTAPANPIIGLAPNSLEFIEGGEAKQVTVSYQSFGAQPTITVEGTPAYVSCQVDGLTVTVTPTAIGNETVTIKGTNGTEVATADLTVSVTSSHGHVADDPYTVAEALAAPLSAEVYVTGKISAITEVSTSHGNATYNISDDGQDTNSMIIYRGKYINGADFTDASQIEVGGTVVVKGQLTQYQSKNQLAAGNQLVSYVAPAQSAWSDTQKAALETALHGYLPPFFGELAEEMTTTENSAVFTVSGYHSGEFATKLGDGWNLVSDNNYMLVGDNYYLTASIYEYGVRSLPVGDYSEFTFAYHEGQPVQNYTVTYTAGQGTGDNYVVSDVEAGSLHALVTFETAEFTAPEGQQFKAWQVGNDAELRDAGYEVTVNGDVTVTAIYEAFWSSEMLSAFETVLHGVIPSYDDSVAALEYVSSYSDFEMPFVATEEEALAELAILCKDWAFDSEYKEYSINTPDGLGVAIGYVYTESGSYSATIQFTQTHYPAALEAEMAQHMHGNIPPVIANGVDGFVYYEGADMFVTSGAYNLSVLSTFQTFATNKGLVLFDSGTVNRPVAAASYSELEGTAYMYGGLCSDGGIIVVELFALSQYSALTINIYYLAQPVSIALSGEFKTTFEYGEQLDTTGMVVTATMSDETEQDATSSAQFSGFDSLVEGEQTVTVTVGNASTTYTVTVNEKVLQKIDVTSEPTKVVYKVGEEFDPEGLEVTATYNGGDPVVLDLADVEISGFDSSTTGEKTVTVAFGGKTASFTVTVEQGYDADAFAKDLLDKVAPICANYDGKKNNKVALKTVWDTMSQLYSTLSNEEKAKVIAAAAKTDGTDLEKAMAFYNYACKKYGLTKFIEGRQVKALVTEHETGNSILPIVVIVASSVAAITAIGVVIALKRRKALLAK